MAFRGAPGRGPAHRPYAGPRGSNAGSGRSHDPHPRRRHVRLQRRRRRRHVRQGGPGHLADRPRRRPVHRRRPGPGRDDEGVRLRPVGLQPGRRLVPAEHLRRPDRRLGHLERLHPAVALGRPAETTPTCCGPAVPRGPAVRRPGARRGGPARRGSAYHLLEAVAAAGVSRIVYVSSLSAVGLAWSGRGAAPVRLPLPEDHPYVGDDHYGLSKQVGELITATVSRRTGIPAVSLRLPFIGTGERLRRHLAHVAADLGGHRGDLWSWIDTRDAAGAVAAALSRPLSGHTVLNVAAPDTTATVPTAQLLSRYHPSVVLTEELEAFAVPIATHRCRELL